MFDPVFIKVLIGTLLLASSSAVVGAFSFLKGESLVGDAIAHALLPGVVLAFILGNGRNPAFFDYWRADCGPDRPLWDIIYRGAH